MRTSKPAVTPAAIKRLTGLDLTATRAFVLKDSFAAGQGFWSHYAGTGSVSCATTAICAYALAEMDALTSRQTPDLQRLLLAFRVNDHADQAGAFPRTRRDAPSAWTTGQAVLALASLGVAWPTIRPSIDWLLRTQAPNGGWNFVGTHQGHERLIYTFYPTLVLARFRRRLGDRGRRALARVSRFLKSCEERDAFWIPLRVHLQRVVAHSRGRRSVAIGGSMTQYWELFEDAWPTIRVDDNWLPERFSMALMCGPNYLHLRETVRPDDPLALLHIRYLIDERIGNGWNDKHEDRPKIWATALGALTLHRWARDLARAGAHLRRVPSRPELLTQLRSAMQPAAPTSRAARALLRRLTELRPGQAHAVRYQHWVRDVFTFLFGDFLKEPRLESETFRGTQRRDVTFRNAAQAGPWFDWKMHHRIDPLLIECKNVDALTYDDIRQTASYLGDRMGRLAILACRKNTGDDVWEILNWFVNNDEKYILVVNDQNLIDWIRLKDRGGNPTDAVADLYRSLREGAQ